MPMEAERAVAAVLRTRGASSIDDLARAAALERDRDEVTRGIQRLITAGRVDVAPDPATGAALYELRERRHPSRVESLE